MFVLFANSTKIHFLIECNQPKIYWELDKQKLNVKFHDFCILEVRWKKGMAKLNRKFG